MNIRTYHTQSPCMGCQDRSLDCHGKCEKYITWKNEMLAEKAKAREEKDLCHYDPWTRASIVGSRKKKCNE